MPRGAFTSTLQRHVSCLSTQLPPIHCARFG
jgi:hypothetical protein